MARHRRAAERNWLPTRESLRRAAGSRTAIGACVLACFALAATSSGAGAGPATASKLGAVAVDGASAHGDAAGLPGSLDRSNATHVLDPTAAEKARLAEEARLAEQARLAAANPTPVAGLNQTQMNNAQRIVAAGLAMGLPKRALVIAIATAMQESNLYNLASTRVPESWNYPNEGSGSDHDSVGLFQQRASAGWGKVAELMDPTYAATAFYNALVRVRGWESMALTWAAQRVQISAYPYAYAKHEPRAQQVVSALTPAAP